MMRWLVLLTTVYLFLAVTAQAAEIDIQLVDFNGHKVENYGCEWNFIDEQDHAHPHNPFFGSRFTRELPNGVWRVIVSCGSLGSGNSRILSTKEKQQHIIKVGK